MDGNMDWELVSAEPLISINCQNNFGMEQLIENNLLPTEFLTPFPSLWRCLMLVDWELCFFFFLVKL